MFMLRSGRFRELGADLIPTSAPSIVKVRPERSKHKSDANADEAAECARSNDSPLVVNHPVGASCCDQHADDKT